MDVEFILRSAYTAEWEAMARTTRPDKANKYNFFSRIALDFEKIKATLTIGEVQKYVDRDIASSIDKDSQEAYHTENLTRLAEFYAHIISGLIWEEQSQTYVKDPEQLYLDAIDSLKHKHVSCSTYPCRDQSRQYAMFNINQTDPTETETYR